MRQGLVQRLRECTAPLSGPLEGCGKDLGGALASTLQAAVQEEHVCEQQWVR